MLLLGAIGSINCTHWERGRQSCQAFEVACSLKQWIFNDHPPQLLSIIGEAVVDENNKSINALKKKRKKKDHLMKRVDVAKYCLLGKVKLSY